MTRELTSDRLRSLDGDQLGAVRSYILEHLGPDALAHAREIRYTPPPAIDEPSLLEARITDEVLDEEGLLSEPAAWLCAFGAGYPPAWKRWDEIPQAELDECVIAELVEPTPAPKRTRRRRT